MGAKFHQLLVYGIAEKVPEKMFTGFIVRSALYHVGEGELKEVLKKMHDEKKPSEIYCTPFLDRSGKVMIWGEEGEFLFKVFSFSWELLDFVKGILDREGVIKHKDYWLEILGVRPEKKELKKKKVGERFRINFYSPTSFRLPPLKRGSTSYFPFPRPDLLLKNLKRTYRINFGKSVQVEEDSLRLVDVIWAKSHTFWDFQDRPFVSFRGSFVFEATEECRKALEILAPMAEACGVGAWRFSGFGRVKFYDSDADK